MIEDETHVLLHCPRYEKEQNNSINELCPNFKKLLNDDKFNYLLNSDGPIVKVVARFFYMASLTHSSVSIILSLSLSRLLSSMLYMPLLKLLMSHLYVEVKQ